MKDNSRRQAHTYMATAKIIRQQLKATTTTNDNNTPRLIVTSYLSLMSKGSIRFPTKRELFHYMVDISFFLQGLSARRKDASRFKIFFPNVSSSFFR